MARWSRIKKDLPPPENDLCWGISWEDWSSGNLITRFSYYLNEEAACMARKDALEHYVTVTLFYWDEDYQEWTDIENLSDTDDEN